VLALNGATMVLEIGAGHLTSSMALLADGWHMATHVGALGLASVAYWASRRLAGHRAFTFGTHRIQALAGYTSALLLGLASLAMILESAIRLGTPREIDFRSSLPVAVVGLVVNLVSVALLDARHDDHDHDHDHNHRAALAHVVADALTSVLAILALLGGRYLGSGWLDPVSGIVGGLVVMRWSAALCHGTGLELLGTTPSAHLEDDVREALEAPRDARVTDLHVWSLGGGATGCVVTLVTPTPLPPEDYRTRLGRFSLSHLTIEVQRDGQAAARASGATIRQR
jgi:cation diffusion facilitator family transporter